MALQILVLFWVYCWLFNFLGYKKSFSWLLSTCLFWVFGQYWFRRSHGLWIFQHIYWLGNAPELVMYFSFLYWLGNAPELVMYFFPVQLRADVSFNFQVIETTDCYCVTLTLDSVMSEFPLSLKEGKIVEDTKLVKRKPLSGPQKWKLKWFSEESLFKFVALLKALHSEATTSALLVYRH